LVDKLGPLVSIILPSYNYAHFIDDAISSVLSQTYGHYELIVVDNYSEDQTSAVVASFLDDRIKFFQFANGGSIAAARNFGVANSTGEIVAFIDADDKWKRTKLSEQVPLHSSLSAVSYHDLKIFGSRNFGKAKGRHFRGDLIVDMLTGGNPIATSSVIVPRHLINFAQGFPEDADIVTAEDFALWLKLAEHKVEFIYLPKTLGHYRLHSVSSSAGKSTRAAKIVVNRYRHRLSPKQQKRMDGWLDYGLGVSEPSAIIARTHFIAAAKGAKFRFKWRAVIRVFISLVNP